MKCAGCGEVELKGPFTEVWHEFCGTCNEQYCKDREQEENQ